MALGFGGKRKGKGAPHGNKNAAGPHKDGLGKRMLKGVGRAAGSAAIGTAKFGAITAGVGYAGIKAMEGFTADLATVPQRAAQMSHDQKTGLASSKGNKH